MQHLAALEDLKLSQEFFNPDATFGGQAIKDFFSYFVPNAQKTISGFSKKFTDTKMSFTNPSPDVQKFLKKVQAHNYATTRHLRMYVPSGFKGNFLDYVNLLCQSAEHVQKIHAELLLPYMQHLADISSSKNSRLQTKDPQAFTVKRFKDARQAIEKQMTAFYNASAVHQGNESTVGSHVARNAEWDDIYVGLNKLKQLCSSIAPSAIAQDVKKIERYLDILLSAAKEDELNELTTESAQSIANTTYEVAEELEFLAVTQYRAMTVDTSFKNTVDKLLTLL